MIFCQLRIVSTIFCVHSEFSSLLVLSTWDYFHTGLFLIGILSTLHSVHFVLNRFWNCLLGSLATCRIVSTIGSVNSGFCSLLVLSTWKFFYLGVSLLENRPLRSLATWHSAHVGFCPLLVLATLDPAHFWLSSLESGHLGVCLLGLCSLGNPCTCYSVNWGLCQGLVVFTLDSPSSFCLLVIMSKQDVFNWDPVYFALCPLGSLSTWTWSTSESGHMTFSPRRVVSTICYVNSGFCSRLVLYPCDSGPTGCLSTLILSTRESGHMTFCPRRIVSTKGFVNSGFCLGLLLWTWASVYLGVYLLGFCPLAGLSTWHSAAVRLCPLLVLSTLGSAHVCFCLLGSQSTLVVVYLNSVYLGSLATWNSAHVGSCLLLVLSTLVCAHFWFCLMGSFFTWDFVYFDSVRSEVCSLS